MHKCPGLRRLAMEFACTLLSNLFLAHSTFRLRATLTLERNNSRQQPLCNFCFLYCSRPTKKVRWPVAGAYWSCLKKMVLLFRTSKNNHMSPAFQIEGMMFTFLLGPVLLGGRAKYRISSLLEFISFPQWLLILQRPATRFRCLTSKKRLISFDYNFLTQPKAWFTQRHNHGHNRENEKIHMYRTELTIACECSGLRNHTYPRHIKPPFCFNEYNRWSNCLRSHDCQVAWFVRSHILKEVKQLFVPMTLWFSCTVRHD